MGRHPKNPSKPTLIDMTMKTRPQIALLFLITMLSGGLAQADAEIIEERVINPRLVELTITTTAFTAPTKVHVNLPAGYAAEAGRRWPVTYYLAGTNHIYADFNEQYGGEQLTQSFDSLVVSPTGNSGYWSDWYNTGAFGPPKYETYVIDELIPLIDGRFRTIPLRAARALRT